MLPDTPSSAHAVPALAAVRAFGLKSKKRLLR
jgi:hypothetical protein